MRYRVIVFSDRTLREHERSVWPFASEQDAADWCSSESIGVEPPFGVDHRRGVIAPFEPRNR